jgi:serine/threonine protein kinase/tetratricopeptide (TPR) repeat protein
MSPDHWARVKEIFQAAQERQPAEREAWLEAACAGDEVLRREVESLLAAHEEAGSFIEKPAVAPETPVAGEELEGRNVGPYRLVRKLGQGGMGAVFLAVRDDAFRKQVALKLIKRGMDTDDILRRFRNERQIVANLDHPNIARLLDGGTTEDGLPYFVMEHVEGQPIDRYCDQRRLTLTQRLEIFRRVCAAVHFAHQNLVVHRDLKPGNILVTSEGVPKLLDFGIAKILDPGSAQTVVNTATELHPMTPEYASPEQVRGEPITTASDVYSLGVLLYELLTGRRPYRLKAGNVHEIARAICEDEPEKPSTAVVRSERGALPAVDGDPARLGRRLAGDLDNIVLMAMRKDPRRRYASAEQLSEDIRRHLSGLPVIARPDTWSYRTGKFVRRNRAAVVAGLLVAASLLAGIVTATWQAHIARLERERADRRFNDVRQLSNALLFDFHDAIEDLPGSTPARELLVKRALQYLDSLAREASGDANLQRELATAYDRVGRIQWDRYYANIGDAKGAFESHRKALKIRTALAGSESPRIGDQEDFADSYFRIGDALIATGKTRPALDQYRKALRVLKELSARNRDDLQLRHFLAITYQRVGDTLGNPMFPNLGDPDGALANYRVMMDLFRSLVAADPKDQDWKHSLAIGHEKLGNLLEGQGDLQGALTHYKRELELYEEGVRTDPHNVSFRRDLAVGYGRVGGVLANSGRPDQALDHFLKMHAIREELAAADPTNAGARHDLALSHGGVGYLFGLLGRTEEARKHYLASLRLCEKIAEADRESSQAQTDLADALLSWGEFLKRSGEARRALEAWERSLDILREQYAKDRANIFVRSRLAQTLGELASLNHNLEREATAREHRSEALALAREIADSPRASPQDLNGYAWDLLTCEPEDLRNPATALHYAARAVEETGGRDPNILDTLALAYFLNGDPERAVSTQSRALQESDPASPSYGEFRANLERFQRALEARAR